MVEVLSQRRIKPRRLRSYLLYTLPAPTCKCGELLAYSPRIRERPSEKGFEQDLYPEPCWFGRRDQPKRVFFGGSRDHTLSASGTFQTVSEGMFSETGKAHQA